MCVLFQLPCEAHISEEEDLLLSSFVDLSFASQHLIYTPPERIEDTTNAHTSSFSAIETSYHNDHTELVAQQATDNHTVTPNRSEPEVQVKGHNNDSTRPNQILSAEQHNSVALINSSSFGELWPMAVLEWKISNENLLPFVSHLASSGIISLSSERFANDYMLLQMYAAMRQVYRSNEDFRKGEKTQSVCLYRTCCADFDRVVRTFFGFTVRFLSNSPQIESPTLLQNGAVTVTLEKPIQAGDIEAVLMYAFCYEGIDVEELDEQITRKPPTMIDLRRAQEHHDENFLVALGAAHNLTGVFAVWHTSSVPRAFDLVFTSNLLSAADTSSNYVINCTLSAQEFFLFDVRVASLGSSQHQMAVHLCPSNAPIDPQDRLCVRQVAWAFSHVRRDSHLVLPNHITEITVPYNPGAMGLHNILNESVVRIPSFDYTTAMTFLTKLYFNLFLIHLVIHFHPHLSLIMFDSRSGGNDKAGSMFQFASSCAYYCQNTSNCFHLEFNPSKMYRF